MADRRTPCNAQITQDSIKYDVSSTKNGIGPPVWAAVTVFNSRFVMTHVYSLWLIPLCTPLLPLPSFLYRINNLKLLLLVLFNLVFLQTISAWFSYPPQTVSGEYLLSLSTSSWCVLCCPVKDSVLKFFWLKHFLIKCTASPSERGILIV